MLTKVSNRILIVSTMAEIKVYYFIKHIKDGKIELIDTDFTVPTDLNVV